ncbi:hypothetical protein H4R33_004556 [Dimargaris cristalligena]|uniref:Mannitol dehydrogenase putative n=1 Tax=Dimargaris cristalligena TaxID=215637 RepID=A0A4P9ZK86_9FUNG|nr:hypothetical protein H4R33_004556 [Dimargaris cristalligena]RKP33647.1 mannitol dehydrogenase putative [Dimargaris cristalligena]|eukprot:RKP33647.1 mannitol dehydrogenase putative [Dimargaris cristalligena]
MTTSTSSESRMISGYAAMGKDQPLVPWQYKPRPLGPNDIEIKIDHCGVCGSDIHTIDSGWGPTQYPVIVGHEIIGRVVAKGAEVQGHAVGDLVGVGAQAFACQKPDCKNCQRGHDAHCPHSVFTYNKPYPDGELSQGGYADAVRVDANYAFNIPAAIDPREAAPLMCAGTTVFTPMLHYKMKAGDRVGVVGIGGLGHLAVQFAKALGAHVTSFTSSEAKREECFKLGATQVVNLRDAEQSKAATQSLDYLIVTSNSPHTDWAQLISFMDVYGLIVLLAIPETELKLKPFSFLANNVGIAGSLIGGIKEVRATLDFAAKHNVRPWIETLPMDQCNEGIQRVRDGKVRYRVVLSN